MAASRMDHRDKMSRNWFIDSFFADVIRPCAAGGRSANRRLNPCNRRNLWMRP